MAAPKPGQACRDPETGTVWRMLAKMWAADTNSAMWYRPDETRWWPNSLARAIAAGPDLTDEVTRASVLVAEITADALHWRQEAERLRVDHGLLEVQMRHERTLRKSCESALLQRNEKIDRLQAELTTLRAMGGRL